MNDKFLGLSRFRIQAGIMLLRIYSEIYQAIVREEGWSGSPQKWNRSREQIEFFSGGWSTQWGGLWNRIKSFCKQIPPALLRENRKNHFSATHFFSLFLRVYLKLWYCVFKECHLVRIIIKFSFDTLSFSMTYFLVPKYRKNIFQHYYVQFVITTI